MGEDFGGVFAFCPGAGPLAGPAAFASGGWEGPLSDAAAGTAGGIAATDAGFDAALPSVASSRR